MTKTEIEDLSYLPPAIDGLDLLDRAVEALHFEPATLKGEVREQLLWALLEWKTFGIKLEKSYQLKATFRKRPYRQQEDDEISFALLYLSSDVPDEVGPIDGTNPTLDTPRATECVKKLRAYTEAANRWKKQCDTLSPPEGGDDRQCWILVKRFPQILREPRRSRKKSELPPYHQTLRKRPLGPLGVQWATDPELRKSIRLARSGLVKK